MYRGGFNRGAREVRATITPADMAKAMLGYRPGLDEPASRSADNGRSRSPESSWDSGRPCQRRETLSP